MKEKGQRNFNGPYEGAHLNHPAMPMGGIGAGMICLEGGGALSHVSLKGDPDVYLEPNLFGALWVNGEEPVARVLEGPVQERKIFGMPGTANGAHGAKAFGLPRFEKARFNSHYPFGTVQLEDRQVPLQVELTGWSPFIPGNGDSCSRPVLALEYEFLNPGPERVDAIFSFHGQNFLACETGARRVRKKTNGFVLEQEGTEELPWQQAALAVTLDDPAARVHCAWFRGGWFDAQTILWRHISRGEAPDTQPPGDGEPSPGGSLFVPFRLEPGGRKSLKVRLSWYAPETKMRVGPELEEGEQAEIVCHCESDLEQLRRKSRHRPWYAGVFDSVDAVESWWREEYDSLRRQSLLFADSFQESSLPPETLEAVAANLSILKSPTVLRQTDGRLWCWEGCCDGVGCCAGSCTHVWNYAQALPHLFPDLERTLRQSEFFESQDERGHQNFRTSLPIRPTDHSFHIAADGQLGGIMKVYRDWRISGNTDWLRAIFPKVCKSLDYCIQQFDPEEKGIVERPHHNTYDIEFWGPDGMCTSFYLGALKAACRMAAALAEEHNRYERLYHLGQEYMETELYNGEYFIQQIRWEGLEDSVSVTSYSPEAKALMEKEGPKYQYGTGCLSDGILGAWMARVCGLGEILDPEKEKSHLRAVHRYNLRRNLQHHANPQRPTYALGEEGGLLLCTWPQGGELHLPFVYSNEVWTGIEYQVASHLIMMGEVEKGAEIVQLCRRRYDGQVRNPFNEYECGHWYARAMASYALLQAYSGARYDAVEKTLYLKPAVEGDFQVFIATETGFGLTGIRDGKPFLEVRSGEIAVRKMVQEQS